MRTRRIRVGDIANRLKAEFPRIRIELNNRRKDEADCQIFDYGKYDSDQIMRRLEQLNQKASIFNAHLGLGHTDGNQRVWWRSE